MKKLFFLFAFFVFLLTAKFNFIQAADSAVAGASALPKERLVEKEEDQRISQLRAYLDSQDSILAEYAPFFIQMADKYGLGEFNLDFLVPAITGLESSFAKRYPQGSYNAYGWNSGNWYWHSWEESIEYVTRALRTKYIDRGADTIYKIGPIYAQSPTWAQRVSYFVQAIESFNPLTERLAFTI